MQSLETFHIALPARYRYLLLIGTTIEAILTQQDELTQRSDIVYQLKLAVHELCNNVIEHAYGHEEGYLTIDICLDHQQRQLIVDLYDRGQPCDLTQAIAPDLTTPQVRGYGLFLARQLSDQLHYERIDDRNHWQLVKVL